jgi:Tfp pilus assembly protein PilN
MGLAYSSLAYSAVADPVHAYVSFVRIALLQRHQKALSDQQSTIKQLKDKASIDSAYIYRLDCTAALLGDFLSANTANTANAAAPTETSAEGTEGSVGTAPLPVSTIYAVLSDLKAAEWKYLQERQKFVKMQPDSAGRSKDLESVAVVGRKRKSQVALEGVVIPVAAQKVVDQLQQQAANVEAGDHSGRLEHYGTQVAARDEVVQHQQLPWSKVVNLAAFAGTCEVAAAAAAAAEKSVR